MRVDVKHLDNTTRIGLDGGQGIEFYVMTWVLEEFWRSVQD